VIAAKQPQTYLAQNFFSINLSQKHKTKFARAHGRRTKMLVEGVKVKAKSIPKSRLLKAWKTLSDEPLPRIKALQLNDEDFDRVIENKRCPEDQWREMEEWGKVLSTRGTDACVFNAGKGENAEFMILVRQNPYHMLDEILVHELSHIANGDL